MEKNHPQVGHASHKHRVQSRASLSKVSWLHAKLEVVEKPFLTLKFGDLVTQVTMKWLMYSHPIFIKGLDNRDLDNSDIYSMYNSVRIQYGGLWLHVLNQGSTQKQVVYSIHVSCGYQGLVL